MCLYLMILFLFIKQMTAYDMRISDWRSDVCSSDLRTVARVDQIDLASDDQRICRLGTLLPRDRAAGGAEQKKTRRICLVTNRYVLDLQVLIGYIAVNPRRGSKTRRSEEHTSELQSLMRISYAVFCLKTKKR